MDNILGDEDTILSEGYYSMALLPFMGGLTVGVHSILTNV